MALLGDKNFKNSNWKAQKELPEVKSSFEHQNLGVKLALPCRQLTPSGYCQH